MFKQCLYFNLATLNRQITKIWQDEFAVLGLSPSHGYLLMAMATHPQASQKELCEIMELDASTITRFIDTLVAKKLVERQGVGKGGSVALSENSHESIQKIQSAAMNLRDKMHSAFGEKKFNSTVNTLHKMRKILQEQ